MKSMESDLDLLEKKSNMYIFVSLEFLQLEKVYYYLYNFYSKILIVEILPLRFELQVVFIYSARNRQIEYSR